MPRSKHYITFLFLGFALTAMLAAFYPMRPVQARNNLSPEFSPPNPLRTITVVGKGSVFMQPDVAHTLIGVQVNDPDIKIASEKAQETIIAVKEALIEQGVKEKDIQTADYSIHMQMDDKIHAMTRAKGETPRSPSSYYVRTALSVTIRDVGRVGDVMAAAIEAGANDIYGISFSAENPDEVMADARKLAVADARARAEELAALHGVIVGEVISISEVIGEGMPMIVEKAMGYGGGGGGFAPGRLQVSAQLQVVYAIQPQPDLSMEEPVSSPTMAVSTASPTEAESVEMMLESGMGFDAPGIIRPITIVGDEPERLRRFVSLWFASDLMSFMPDEMNPQLILGRLPEDIPLPADVFDGFEVLGVLNQGANLGLSMLLEVQGDAEMALATLEQRLRTAGLREPPNVLGALGGFGVDAASIPALYCNDKDGSWLIVTANDLSEGGALLQVDVNPSDEMTMSTSPCDMLEEGGISQGALLIPPLEAPEGTRVMADSAGGGPNSFYQSAIIRTSLRLGDLDSQYQQQLQEAGWELMGSDRTEAIAWSEWQLNDKEGNPRIGSLLITKRFTNENHYMMLLRVEQAPKKKERP